MFVVLAVAGTSRSTAGGLKAAAYRYETGDVGTTHDYHHAQPSVSLLKGGKPLPGVTTPMNDASPAFPLDATGIVGLTMCFLRSLYGQKAFNRMLGDQSVRQSVTPFLSQMPVAAAGAAMAVMSSGSPAPSPVPSASTGPKPTPPTTATASSRPPSGGQRHPKSARPAP